jgi:hypothetical protein
MNIQSNGTKHRDTHYNGNLHDVLNCDTYHIGLNYNTQHNDSVFGINTKYHVVFSYRYAKHQYVVSIC